MKDSHLFQKGPGPQFAVGDFTPEVGSLSCSEFITLPSPSHTWQFIRIKDTAAPLLSPFTCQ